MTGSLRAPLTRVTSEAAESADFECWVLGVGRVFVPRPGDMAMEAGGLGLLRGKRHEWKRGAPWSEGLLGKDEHECRLSVTRDVFLSSVSERVDAQVAQPVSSVKRGGR